jgi:hypothetical protein
MMNTNMPDPFPRILIALMKGVVYRDDDAGLWQVLSTLQARVYDYVSILNLQLIVDESEGYAYLRQQLTAEEGAPSTESELPRLVARRPLGYGLSLLLALLRKRLAESDVTSGDTRLIVSRDDLIELMRLFTPDGSNEARLTDRLDTHIGKAIDLGFLRPLQGRADQYEVRRILKAFVDAQWLHNFDDRLAAYRQHTDARA